MRTPIVRVQTAIDRDSPGLDRARGVPMATQLDVHVSARRRVVLLGVTVVLGPLVAAGLFLP